MNSPILSLPEKFDASILYQEYISLGIKKNQIHVSSHDGKTYEFDDGYIYGYADPNQNNYTKINDLFKGSYIEKVYKAVDKKYKVCRARLMRMSPENRAYSYHYDQSPRLHIPIKTNRDSLFIVNDVIYRMPEPGRLYRMDTVQLHSAVMLSREEDRIHLVFCLRNDEIL